MELNLDKVFKIKSDRHAITADLDDTNARRKTNNFKSYLSASGIVRLMKVQGKGVLRIVH